jgi:TRAP-type C4-dicarboxylate transport system substrate-binding protein
MEPKLVKWVLAHEPIDIFIKAAEKFTEVIDKLAPGQLKIEVMTLSEYADRYNNGKKITKHDLLQLMEDNLIEMSQTYSYVLGNKYSPDMHVVDMPFLFRDHDHAANVFEGKIGAKLLDSYGHNSNLQGLAFTYSGGFRNIPFSKNVATLNDLAGARVRVTSNPICEAIFESIGATPVTFDIEELADRMEDGTVEGGESSWPRIYACRQNEVSNVIFDTEHNLLTTNIIANKQWMQGLPVELQAKIKQAAIEAARHERDISVADVERVGSLARADGIRVIKFSEEDQTHFKKATESVYTKFEDYFSPGLVDSIRTLH